MTKSIIPGMGKGHTAHFTDYLANEIGRVDIEPQAPIIAGSYVSLDIKFTTGRFGVDDTGSIRISRRLVSDPGTPQFTDPSAPNYVTAEASNGATLVLSFDPHLNMRPWNPTITIKVKRGFLTKGDTITVKIGDRTGGSPGFRMQTFFEENFQFLVLADVFATCNWTLLPGQTPLKIVAGPPHSYKAIFPTVKKPGEKFSLTLRADDRWGNPTHDLSGSFRLTSSDTIEGLPETIEWVSGQKYLRIEGLSVPTPHRSISIAWLNERGETLCISNSLSVEDREQMSYWADLHGQSGETVGTGTLEDYAHYARNLAAIDVICHQGNDFQITDSIWAQINEAAEQFDEPGRFVFFPGYEWSGNSALGGDRNVIYPEAGRPIFRSSRALVEGDGEPETDAYDAHALHHALKSDGRPTLCIPHVGGRYANLPFAHDPELERAVEVHSDWGTFDWLLEDAFSVGARVGIVANSDGHQGRQGASHPGAATFGSYGGLTCILADSLTRESIFTALRRRRHYATTNAARHDIRIGINLSNEADLHEDDPVLERPASARTTSAMMGDILTGVKDDTVEFRFSIAGQTPIQRVEIYNKSQRLHTLRPYDKQELGERLSIQVEGSEYRGRGRDTHWDLDVDLENNSWKAVSAVNRWNLETLFETSEHHVKLGCVTTGGFMGFQAVLDEGMKGTLNFRTKLVSGSINISELDLDDIVLDAGGLGRQVRISRLPTINSHRQMDATVNVSLMDNEDNAIYLKATFEDGSVAWTSPIYLIKSNGHRSLA